MSLDEIVRFKESYKRRKEQERKEVVNYLYTLAEIMPISLARLYSKTAKYPPKEELFPDLFKTDEQLQIDAFVKNFKMFANSHNKKFAKKEAQQK